MFYVELACLHGCPREKPRQGMLVRICILSSAPSIGQSQRSDTSARPTGTIASMHAWYQSITGVKSTQQVGLCTAIASVYKCLHSQTLVSAQPDIAYIIGCLKT